MNTSKCKHTIKMKNIENSVHLTYSMLLLVGEIVSENIKSCDSIYIIANNNKSTYRYRVTENMFKCLVDLDQGKNSVILVFCNETLNLDFYFKPRVTKHCVTPLYIKFKGHTGHFQGPNNEKNTSTTACKKISIGAKLIQTFFAEKLFEMGFARNTFQLESDFDQTVPTCTIFESELHVNSVYKMTEGEIWASLGREIMSSPLKSDTRKYLAFISCTKYNGTKFDETTVTTHEDIVAITDGHVALGGGGLAIFGSACLYTWPETVDQIETCFFNETIIDKTQYMDDSCYRGTFGACFTTTLGSVCHELGHTFDLGHTEIGVMGRGFDNINRMFVNVPRKIKIYDSPSSHSAEKTKTVQSSIEENKLQYTKLSTKNLPQQIRSNDLTVITRNCALIIYFNKWFQNTLPAISSIIYNNETHELNSTHALCVLEIRDVGSEMVLNWWEFSLKNPVKRFRIPDSVYYKNAKFVIAAENAVGYFFKTIIEIK